MGGCYAPHIICSWQNDELSNNWHPEAKSETRKQTTITASEMHVSPRISHTATDWFQSFCIYRLKCSKAKRGLDWTGISERSSSNVPCVCCNKGRENKTNLPPVSITIKAAPNAKLRRLVCDHMSWTVSSAQPQQKGIIYGGVQIEGDTSAWIFSFFYKCQHSDLPGDRGGEGVVVPEG